MTATAFNQDRIAEILPQQYPFIMIDRVVDFKKGKSLTAIKNITGNEWIFEGGMENGNVFPETLIIEAAAQAAIVLAESLAEDRAGRLFIIGKIKSEFFSPVCIGDVMTIGVVSIRSLASGGFVTTEVFVGQEKKADIEIFYGISEGLKHDAS